MHLGVIKLVQIPLFAGQRSYWALDAFLRWVLSSVNNFSIKSVAKSFLGYYFCANNA